MRQRLRLRLGERATLIQIITLHALALSIVRLSPTDAGLPEMFELGMSERRRDSLLDRCLDEFRSDASFPSHLLEPRIAWRAIRNLKHSQAARLLHDDGSAEVRLCMSFDKLVRADKVVLFDDLGVAALRLLRGRPDLRQRLQKRHRAVFVDEYQDIDATQFMVIEELTPNPAVLTVVGDDDQCIYTWRGANPGYLLNFERRFPDASSIVLSANHRSTEQIVKASRAVIERNRVRIPKTLESARSIAGPQIRVCTFESIRREVTHAVGLVSQLLRQGTDPREIAILARNNDMVQAFVLEMVSNVLPVHVKNPMRTSSGTALLNLLRTVRDGPGDPFFQACVNIGERRLRKSVFRSLTPGGELKPSQTAIAAREWATRRRRSDPPGGTRSTHRRPGVAAVN